MDMLMRITDTNHNQSQLLMDWCPRSSGPALCEAGISRTLIRWYGYDSMACQWLPTENGPQFPIHDSNPFGNPLLSRDVYNQGMTYIWRCWCWMIRTWSRNMLLYVSACAKYCTWIYHKLFCQTIFHCPKANKIIAKAMNNHSLLVKDILSIL